MAKTTAELSIEDDCDVVYIQNTALSFYDPFANPFGDTPVLGPILLPDHCGFRMKVDLP